MEDNPLLRGYRCKFNDRQVVECFLHNRAAMGDQFKTDAVSDCPDFYGQNDPWVIWFKYADVQYKVTRNDEDLYFYTHRRKFDPDVDSFDIKVGSGTWTEQYSEDVVDSDGNLIGVTTHYRYEGGCDSRHNGAWLMQEFELIENADATDQQLVFCTLSKNQANLPPSPTINESTTATANKGNDVGECCSKSST